MLTISYEQQFCDYIKNLDKRQKLLLHSCCAPCTSSVLERLTPHFDVTLYFYNPNITKKEEYEHRLSELYRFIDIAYDGKIQIIDGGFCPDVFFEFAKGKEEEKEGSSRCYLCYTNRLTKTAEMAKVGLYDCFCTTLSVSPYKNAQKINQIGMDSEAKFGVKFLPSDFKKKQGYVRSIELSKKYGLYRQNYCGCIYSYNQWLLKSNQSPKTN